MPAPTLTAVPANMPEPPYPADTKAKGWRFELDYQQIDQSDTWALAPPEMRPWLLMLWLTSWRQIPAASFSDNDQVIAAKIGMDERLFLAHKDILLRGWARHSDGRIYHPVIVAQISNMLEIKEKSRVRKQEYRAKLSEEQAGVSHGTPTGLPRESSGSPHTGTGTGTGTSKREEGGPHTDPPNARSARPTLEEVRKYVREKNYSIDPEQFFDYYTANGWFQGKAKIKDWKACVRTWVKRDSGKADKPKKDPFAGAL